MLIQRLHMTATADGRVVAIGCNDAGDHAIVDDGEVTDVDSDREEAWLSFASTAGGRS